MTEESINQVSRDLIELFDSLSKNSDITIVYSENLYKKVSKVLGITEYSTDKEIDDVFIDLENNSKQFELFGIAFPEESYTIKYIPFKSYIYFKWSEKVAYYY